MAEVLKGGISNIKYIWHSSENACKDCQALDGKEYDFEEDIPDKPHPNCQCWIEEREDEPCDCEEYFAQIEEMIGEGSSLLEEIEYEISENENLMSNIANINIDISAIIDVLSNCTKNLIDIFQTVKIFVDNFLELQSKNNGRYDKYYHAKANCEAAQLGIIGEETATQLSDAKEAFDMSVNAIIEAIKTRNEILKTIKEKVEDSEEDQETNREGREMGRMYPDAVCGEMLEYKIPEDLRK